MKFELNLHVNKLTKEEITSDMRRIAKSIKKDTVSINEYTRNGKYSARNIERKFGSWNNALKEAGLETGLTMNLSDRELFTNLEKVWTSLGRQPTLREMIPPLSSISASPYRRKYSNWNKALVAFIEYINQDDEGVSKNEEPKNTTQEEVIEKKIQKRTKREISDRLRFRILLRDGFTCAKCGRSPMKERGVELHVDHIIPWSKDGETLPDNLETKCSTCNLGKGNAFQV
jgi:5-methylcytosine-specific restriction endonuclease McrA